MEDFIVRGRQRFRKLLEMVNYPKPGVYCIEVVQVLGVGEYYLGLPEVAVVKDTGGRIWAIPEDRNDGKPSGRLVSRWDVKKGTRLRVLVAERNGEKEVKEVVVIKKR